MAEPTVFIIDDDEAFRDSVKELVSSVGLAAETFRSALEFLEAFDPARPGCLVLDVRMARMSGIALQAKLKEMGARIPIVFISGHGDIAMAVNAIKDGAVDFVQKPYHEQQLLDAIDEALRRDAAQRAPPADAGGLTARVAYADRPRARGDGAGPQRAAEQGHRQGAFDQSPDGRAAPEPAAREARRQLGHRADAPHPRSIRRVTTAPRAAGGPPRRPALPPPPRTGYP